MTSQAHPHSCLLGHGFLVVKTEKAMLFLYAHIYIILFSSDCINTKRRIRDAQSFQEMFRDKPYLTITNVQKEYL